MAYIWSTAAVAVATVSGRLFSALAPLPNISMVFLMAVLFSAVSFGMRPAIYASVLSFLSYNFFFIEPLYTFQITEPHELLALIIFLIVAIVTSALAGRVRDQARAANERAGTMRRLYEFTWKLSGLTGVGAIAVGAAGQMPAGVVDIGRGPSGRSRSGEGPSGRSRSDVALDSEARALLATLAEQTAGALDRALMAHEMMTAQIAAETERVRNILLSSVSHDF